MSLPPPRWREQCPQGPTLSMSLISPLRRGWRECVACTTLLGVKWLSTQTLGLGWGGVGERRTTGEVQQCVLASMCLYDGESSAQPDLLPLGSDSTHQKVCKPATLTSRVAPPAADAARELGPGRMGATRGTAHPRMGPSIWQWASSWQPQGELTRGWILPVQLFRKLQLRGSHGPGNEEGAASNTLNFSPMLENGAQSKFSFRKVRKWKVSFTLWHGAIHICYM